VRSKDCRFIQGCEFLFRFGVYDKPGNVSKERKFGLRAEAIGFTRGRGAIVWYLLETFLRYHGKIFLDLYRA